MFSFFKSKTVSGTPFGELKRSGGAWRGRVSLAEFGEVPLVISGSSDKPSEKAIAAAQAFIAASAQWLNTLEEALFEHFEPYSEEEESAALAPAIARASDVWPHVQPVFLAVAETGTSSSVELGLKVNWDLEHTLGARFSSGRFVELCGSVLSP